MYSIIILILVLAVIGSAIGTTVSAASKHKQITKLSWTRQIDNSIYLGSIALWSFLFYTICTYMDLDMSANPYILFGFLWPVLLLLVRMANVRNDQKETNQESHVQHNDTRGSAGLLFTAAFGVGVILTSIKQNVNATGSKLVLLSLLFCVAFLIPTNSFPVESNISHSIRTAQACLTQMAIGIMITGISVSYFG